MKTLPQINNSIPCNPPNNNIQNSNDENLFNTKFQNLLH